MSWGLNNRLSRIIKNGKVVMLAVDHGYFQGPTTGLENPKQLLRSLIPNSDALMITRGLLRTTINSQSNIPIVLRVSGGTSILKELSNEEITTSIEEAIKEPEKVIILDLSNGNFNYLNDHIYKLINLEVNNSNISAIVEDLSKKNKDKYYEF